MSFFSFAKSPSSNSAFGYKVSGVEGIPSELEAVKGTIVRTSKKYREELSKYREIAAFNEQLSKGYIRNLEAMVDVSKILNYYVDIFNVLKEEFDQNDKIMGSTLTPIDIGYLERLTKSKMDELNNKFMNESEKLKKIYTTYGKSQEIARVVEAQNNLRATTEGADKTYANINRLQQQQQPSIMAGGKSVGVGATKKERTAAKKSTGTRRTTLPKAMKRAQ